MYWSIADMILDLTQNSIEAHAAEVTLAVSQEDESRIAVSISDNGRGMTPDHLQRALDPFWSEPGKHPGRRVGLGLPFLKQTVDQTGGTWEIHSEAGVGTELSFTLDMTHPDTPPLGDLISLWVALMCYDRPYELHILRRYRGSGYEVSRSDLQEALGDISTISNRRLAAEFLAGAEEELAMPG